MDGAGHFRLFGRYNAWANRRLYDASAALPEDERRRDRRAFFGSIHNTLNHLIVADRIWLGRIESGDVAMAPLDSVPYDRFDDLRAAREAEDARIRGLVDALDEPALERAVVYRNSSGGQQRTPLRLVLAHFFNHQTHHRAQVHDMLSQAGTAPPPLDLIFFQREEAG